MSDDLALAVDVVFVVMENDEAQIGKTLVQVMQVCIHSVKRVFSTAFVRRGLVVISTRAMIVSDQDYCTKCQQCPNMSDTSLCAP